MTSAKKTLKSFVWVIAAIGMFTAGYFWALTGMDHEMGTANRSSDAAAMPGMDAMAGMHSMTGMAPGMVMVTPEKQQLLNIRTTTVERKPLIRSVRTVGIIVYDETRVTHIHSKVEGWIEKLYANFTGKWVEKGQPLFTIYSPDLLATQQEYLLALKARDRLSASTIPEIKSSGPALVEAAERRLALWDISEEQIRQLEAKGEAQRTLTLHAPHAGFVVKKEVYDGMKVMPDKEIFAIADLSAVWVNVDIYESEIPFIRSGQVARVNLSYDPATTFKGRVSYIYPYLDDKTRTAKARLEVLNSGFKLKPDMYVNAEIEIHGGNHLAVPLEAVLDSGTKKVVFIDRGGGHFEPKEVKLGAAMDGFYPVLAGLKEGEKIAASSAFILDSESRLGEAMAAMAGMPGMSGMDGMKDMRMGGTTQGSLQEKKTQDLTLVLSTRPEQPKAGENTLRLKITDRSGSPVRSAQVVFQYSMNMPGMVLSKTEAKLSNEGFYESKANLSMLGEWEVTVIVRRSGQKEIEEKFKLLALQ